MRDWKTLIFNSPLPISSLEGKAKYFFSQLPLFLEGRGGTAHVSSTCILLLMANKSAGQGGRVL